MIIADQPINKPVFSGDIIKKDAIKPPKDVFKGTPLFLMKYIEANTTEYTIAAKPRAITKTHIAPREGNISGNANDNQPRTATDRTTFK